MQSLELADLDGRGTRSRGPARGYDNVLPLGAVRRDSLTNGGGHGKEAAVMSINGDIPGSGPLRPPPGPPAMVVFPSTLHLAIFAVPSRPALVAIALLTCGSLPTLFGKSQLLEASLRTNAGAGSGFFAGLMAGIGVRSRPAGLRGCLALVRWNCRRCMTKGVTNVLRQARRQLVSTDFSPVVVMSIVPAMFIWEDAQDCTMPAGEADSPGQSDDQLEFLNTTVC